MMTRQTATKRSNPGQWSRLLAIGCLACLGFGGCLKSPSPQPARKQAAQNLPAAIPPTAAEAAQTMRNLGARLIRSQTGAVRHVIMTALPVGNDALGPLAQMDDVEVLGLSDTRITDEGLEKLVGMKRLSYLFLNNTQVTDQGLLSLADIPALRYVSVNQTDISNEALERFRKLSPGTVVQHSPRTEEPEDFTSPANAASLATAGEGQDLESLGGESLSGPKASRSRISGKANGNNNIKLRYQGAAKADPKPQPE